MDSITLETLRQNMNSKHTTWENIETTNCYAYALNLDYPQSKIGEYAYNVGALSGKTLKDEFTYEELIEYLLRDLRFLKCQIKEIDPMEETEENSYKIAVFTEDYRKLFDEFGYSDYHFLREEETGIWTHKKGFKTEPLFTDDDGNSIEDPSKCHIKGYQYCKCFQIKR